MSRPYRRLPRRRQIGIAVAAMLVVACGTTGPISTRPPLRDLETVGLLETEELYADHRVFRLKGGQVWDRPNDAFRVAYEQPAGSTLFVAGSDAEGTFVLLIGGQDGLPSTCEHAIGYGGRDWGNAIEAEGFLWTKSAAYAGPDLPIGAELPSTVRVCLNERAHATAVVDIRPSGDPGT